MLALLAVGCGGDDDEPAIPATVLSARVVVDNPTEVYLRTDQCSKLSDMSETNSAIHVTVEAVFTELDGGAICSGHVTINLDQPLGNRRVIDDRSGSAVEVFNVTGRHSA
jgi:hypothetical protein